MSSGAADREKQIHRLTWRGLEIVVQYLQWAGHALRGDLGADHREKRLR